MSYSENPPANIPWTPRYLTATSKSLRSKEQLMCLPLSEEEKNTLRHIMGKMEWDQRAFLIEEYFPQMPSVQTDRELAVYLIGIIAIGTFLFYSGRCLYYNGCS